MRSLTFRVWMESLHGSLAIELKSQSSTISNKQSNQHRSHPISLLSHLNQPHA